MSLVEGTVAVAIAAIALSSAAPGFQAALARRHLDGAATQLAADLQFVRTEAVVRGETVRISFHSDAAGSCYVVHTRQRALCGCDAGRATCGGGAELIRGVALPAPRGVTVASNVGSMTFDPSHGTVTPAATLRVVGAAGEVRHVVNVLGRVRSCSPGGAVAGWRAC